MKKMKPVPVILTIAVIILFVIVAIYGFILYASKNMYLDGPDMKNHSDLGKSLTYVEWHRSGGSDGAYYMVSVEKLSDNKALVRITDREGAGADDVEKSHEVSAEIFDELGKIIDYNDMLNWDKLEKSEYVVLDEPTIVLIIKQGDAVMTTSSDLDWPNYDAVTSIKNIIENGAADPN